MSGLARRLLNNPGLLALTVPEEQREIRFAAFVGSAHRVRPHKIKFAHFQSDFKGGRIPYWHVLDSTSPSYQSTLSMEGLKTWGVL